VIGETTFEIGPGAKIWIAAGSCPGMVVFVDVGWGVGLRVARGVLEGRTVGVSAKATWVPKTFAASAVNAITVGRYSGGYTVGMGLAAGVAQAARSPRRGASKQRFRFMRTAVQGK